MPGASSASGSTPTERDEKIPRHNTPEDATTRRNLFVERVDDAHDKDKSPDPPRSDGQPATMADIRYVEEAMEKDRERNSEFRRSSRFHFQSLHHEMHSSLGREQSKTITIVPTKKMSPKELHEKWLRALGDKILWFYHEDIRGVDKDGKSLLVEVKNGMRKRQTEEKMKDFWKKEEARAMVTKFDSQAGLDRITSAAFYKISQMIKAKNGWPLLDKQKIQTRPAVNHEYPDFSMSSDGYVFIRGTFDKDDEEMIVEIPQQITIAGNFYPRADVKKHIRDQLEKQTYPFINTIRLVNESTVLQNAKSPKEHRVYLKELHGSRDEQM